MSFLQFGTDCFLPGGVIVQMLRFGDWLYYLILADLHCTRMTWGGHDLLFFSSLLNRFLTTSLSRIPHQCGWKRIAAIPGCWPSFWDSQHDDSVMGTVTLFHLYNHVVRVLPCDETLCGTIVWVLWCDQIDVHSRNCVFTNERYTVSACTKMSVWHVFFFNIPNEVARTHTRVRFRLRFECTTWNVHW